MAKLMSHTDVQASPHRSQVCSMISHFAGEVAKGLLGLTTDQQRQ